MLIPPKDSYKSQHSLVVHVALAKVARVIVEMQRVHAHQPRQQHTLDGLDRAGQMVAVHEHALLGCVPVQIDVQKHVALLLVDHLVVLLVQLRQIVQADVEILLAGRVQELVPVRPEVAVHLWRLRPHLAFGSFVVQRRRGRLFGRLRTRHRQRRRRLLLLSHLSHPKVLHLERVRRGRNQIGLVHGGTLERTLAARVYLGRDLLLHSLAGHAAGSAEIRCATNRSG